MFTKIITIILTLALCWTTAFVAGCQNDAQSGALIGGVIGTGVGQLAGGNTEATLIGAAVGTGAGYIIGNESDKNKTRTQMLSMRDDIDSQIVNVTNSNGSIVQVRLKRYGAGWLGTRGEYYPTLPTSEQLRPVYGF